MPGYTAYLLTWSIAALSTENCASSACGKLLFFRAAPRLLLRLRTRGELNTTVSRQTVFRIYDNFFAQFSSGLWFVLSVIQFWVVENRPLIGLRRGPPRDNK